MAICCEFFNNIGVDELKPDVHVIRVLGSIGIKGMTNQDPEKAREEGKENKENNADVRLIGIMIAETLGKPRKYVDLLFWNFGRNVCKKVDPTCKTCKLKTEHPPFCKGMPEWDGFLKEIIVKDTLGVVGAMKSHGFTLNEAYSELRKSSLPPNKIKNILKKVYGKVSAVSSNQHRAGL